MSAGLAVPSDVFCPLNEVVLLDDDDLTIEIVTWILSKGSHKSHLFSQTAPALDYLKDNTPRLLIVDYYMPEMTGLDFISELYGSVDLSQTQVYLCSAVSPPEESEKLFKAMNVDLLEKQLICDRSELTKLLNDILDVA